jgi:GH25 family lysozyme M1 (1,4-beta-N-acetylmuramidase)
MAVVPLVVDISHGDRVDSFEKARGAGLRGVIHKATTGATGRDDAYRGRRQLAVQANLLWGAYHWGTHADVSHQVENFISWAEPDGNTLVALDFERTYGNQMTLDQAREFLTLLGQKLDRRPVIYGGSVLKESLGNRKDEFFGSHRLWLAQYGNHPVVQASWSSFWLWQYTDGEHGPDPKTVAGIPGDSKHRLDCDHFAGSPELLSEQWASLP